MKKNRKATRPLALFCVLILAPGVFAGQWSEPAKVRYRERAVVSYRAKLDGNILVIEATHVSGWHTYAMDNVERAQKKTGKVKPETELPTRIELSGGLRAVGNWFQSKPIDLSQPELRWYTWGFENVARFAVKVARVDGARTAITINGQACNASLCSRVDDLAISLPLPSRENFAASAARTSVNLSQFVKVKNP